MLKEIKLTKLFKNDVERYKNVNSKDLNELLEILNDLANEKGVGFLNYKSKNRKECHMKSGLILIYRIDDETLYLERLGSHTELFK